MERRLKERLIGAAVLVMLAVIFIPMILDDSVDNDTSIRATNIPPRPEGEFNSQVVPLEEKDLDLQSVPVEIGVIQEEEPEPQPVEPPPPDYDDETVAEQEPESIVKQQAPIAPTPKPEKTPAPEPVAKSSTEEPRGVTAWVVQLGSFSSEENANALNEKLRKQKFPAFVEPIRQKSGTMVFRVRVGPELLRTDAQALKEKLDKTLKDDGLEGIVVRYP